MPVDILADRATRELRVEWSDGHLSIYRFAYLRVHCPCPSCRGNGEASVHENDGDGGKVGSIRVVGGTALQVCYEDGHDDCIYTFEHLREICPCGRQSCRR